MKKERVDIAYVMESSYEKVSKGSVVTIDGVEYLIKRIVSVIVVEPPLAEKRSVRIEAKAVVRGSEPVILRSPAVVDVKVKSKCILKVGERFFGYDNHPCSPETLFDDANDAYVFKSVSDAIDTALDYKKEACYVLRPVK